MNALINILRFLWEQPASLIGYSIVFFGRGKKRTYEFQNGKVVTYYVLPWIGSSVQLGMVSLIAQNSAGNEKVIRHEALGHGTQSTILGPLYLLIVGLPSVIRNRYAAWKNKPSSWYYGYYPDESVAFPEKWADQLGGVSRPKQPY